MTYDQEQSTPQTVRPPLPLLSPFSAHVSCGRVPSSTTLIKTRFCRFWESDGVDVVSSRSADAQTNKQSEWWASGGLQVAGTHEERALIDLSPVDKIASHLCHREITSRDGFKSPLVHTSRRWFATYTRDG